MFNRHGGSGHSQLSRRISFHEPEHPLGHDGPGLDGHGRQYQRRWARAGPSRSWKRPPSKTSSLGRGANVPPPIEEQRGEEHAANNGHAPIGQYTYTVGKKIT